MFRNYLLTTLRKLSRQKSHTSINVLGLALGMTCCIFIYLIIQHESSFDNFHRQRERIYRIVTDEHMNDLTSTTMGSPFPMAEALRTDFPQLEKVAAVFGNYSGLFAVTRADQTVARFQEADNVGFVEPQFFEIFDFPWVLGDPQSLNEAGNVALTEDAARKYFGATDPMGQSLRMDNQFDLKVTGIVKNFPRNTDFPFQVLIAWKTVGQTGWDVAHWGNLTSNVNTYVLLSPHYTAAELQSQLPAFKIKYHPLENDPSKRVHHVQALRDIHHDGRYGNYSQRTTAKSLLLALGLVGVFLLLTACINFINIATAQALARAKEVGVRKVLGARRAQLLAQFLGETFVITLLAAVMALVFVELLLPSVNALLRLQLQFAPLHSFSLFAFLNLLLLAVAVLAGLYPAFVLSGFMPVRAIKSQIATSNPRGLHLRRGLVILQFLISQMLIIGTLIITQQMDFFRTKEMGFDQTAIVTVPLPSNAVAKLQTLRTALAENRHIKNVTWSYSSAVSSNSWDTNLLHTVQGPAQQFASDLKFADANYIPTYDLKLIAGRNYAPSDTVFELVVNETFARKLGLSPQEIIGKTFKMGRRPYLPVVGVVQDFHTRPLQEEVRPCVLASNWRAYFEASIKLETANLADALAHLEKTWSTVFPEFVYSYQFLDERIANFYAEEQKMAQLFRVFAALAIFIGCLGLFGLISFVAAQKTKEIGVRKVLGASVQNILLLFGREFALLIGIAFALAAPMAYFIMQSWLENYAYRIVIGPGVFALALAGTLALAAATIGYRAFKAAATNPVDALKYE